jgi:CCR4-NOT transcription complex subunit 10
MRVAKLRRQYQLTSVISRRLTTPIRTYTVLPMSDIRLFARYPENDEFGPLLTLEFAEKCARNAIEMCGDSHPVLKQKSSLLCEYICLELGDWEQTNELNKALTGPAGDPITKFLSRVYAAQASYMMHDFGNACGLLKPNLIEVQVNQRLEYATMLYQTAWRAFQANNSEKDKSQIYMNKAAEGDANCREMILTKVAAELQNKKIQNALKCLDSYQERD